MADNIKRCEYYYILVPHKIGAGVGVFETLKAEGVNLIAFLGFPAGWGRAQLDFFPEDKDKFISAIKKAGYKAIGPRTAFLIQGDERTGAVADILEKLKQAQINITAMEAVSGGQGRYGAVLWVKPADINKASQALGIA